MVDSQCGRFGGSSSRDQVIALLGQWRFGLYGLIVAALLIGGWAANGWRMRAAQAAHLQAALQASIAREVEANAARVALAAQLSEAESATHETIKTVTKQVKVYVPADPRCNIDDNFRQLLDRARTGVPATADEPAAPAPVP